MSRVAIVTDSSADLAPDQVVAHGIHVVPLFVRFGEREYRVGVDLSTEGFWEELLKPGAPFPSTAAPSPGTFRETFEGIFAAGAEAIIAVLIGSKISATFAAATLAAEALPDREIHVVDSGSTSMSTGIPAILAAEMAAAGIPPRRSRPACATACPTSTSTSPPTRWSTCGVVAASPRRGPRSVASCR